MDTTVGLRERKKAETRQAVHEAAMRLTVELGLDNVTVEAISDAANISRRTFSNYFAGKEDALLYGEEQRIWSLLKEFRERPAEETTWQALVNAARSLHEEIGEPNREWALQTRLAKQHPSVLARQMANHVRVEREFAQAIAVRDGEEPGAPRSRVLAAAFLMGLRIAANMWIEGQQSGDAPLRTLLDIAEEVLAEVARPFL
ncbi:TetR/AcrR family transcriptional regulator [Microtetraspora sp. NBRC 16547]|uniref:TetR/AcrR family transcriptional regulator n=1 Tax=Microtetraspora sp. NBRC 16547 TaxID=3030993 RepID=UPI0024A1DA39|nr:TetR/AcrR family transcriptional regulator [Microtetraspora sp. NBRC 16547]GLX02783.1 TetR family transcriptional regulator [Microtetraspora sp. NBRC 16547]